MHGTYDRYCIVYLYAHVHNNAHTSCDLRMYTLCITVGIAVGGGYVVAIATISL